MSIYIIKGPSKSGKSELANALRNNAITHKRGALLIDENQEGDVKPLLEKIIAGVPLPDQPKVGSIPWKDDPMIILVGKKEAMLDKLEKAVPGFTKKMGPIYRIKTGA